MPTTVNLRKILHRPQWEPCTPSPLANAAGGFFRTLKLDAYNINIGCVGPTVATVSVGALLIYDPVLDGYVSSGAIGTAFPGIAAGTAGRIHPVSVLRTATAGTTSTITTNITIVRDLRGYKIRIGAGPSANGQELTILSNTIGTNSVITVATQGVAFSNATTYNLLTPNVYVVGSGALAAGTFQRYDWALNAWTALTNTNLPATIATDSWLVATPSIVSGAFDASTTGGYAFSSSTGTTLVVTGPSWTTNQWKNSQVRITSGLGAGQVRTVSENTGTRLTVSAAWATNPDATSVWQLEGNDDYLYYIGSAAVGVIRYSISGNAWTALTVATGGGAARTAAPGAGMSASWVHGCTDAAWTNKNAIKNGRYIYSFRGNAGNVLDILDIAAPTQASITVLSWESGRVYGNQFENFTTGQSWEYDGRDNIYGSGVPVASGPARTYRFNLITNALEPMHSLNYPQGAATVGDKLSLIPYVDGSTRIDFLYHWRNTGTEVFRTIVSPFVY